MMFDIGLSGSSSASAASGQGDFVFNRPDKTGWIPWVVLGAVSAIALVLVFRRKK